MNGLMMKAGIGTVMAATALSFAAPAEAQRWRGGGRYDRGDVAGAALLGGVVGLGVGAAIASNGPGWGPGWGGGYYGGYYGPRRFYGPPVVYRPRVFRPRVVYRGYPYRNPYRWRRGAYRW